jgi:hypothetical protein
MIRAKNWESFSELLGILPHRVLQATLAPRNGGQRGKNGAPTFQVEVRIGFRLEASPV